MKRIHWLVLVAALFVTTTADGVHAQTSGTLTGQVIDAATAQPLASVQVVVPGTTLGTLTNAQGRFTLVNVPAGPQQVRAGRVGYASSTQTATVPAGGSAAVDFQLSTSAVALDEIVVTGTAGAIERRTQPAVVSTVAASDIVENGTVSSLQDLLTARVPGVQVTGSSGTSGTAQQIRIRGASSISLSNEPLVFIDGVRADARSQSNNTGAGLAVGGQAQSRLFDLNPEDIESIEIVKGPAAATLYGADASAGVIQIITKKGTTGANQFRQNISLEYNNIDPNFEPLTAFARCGATHVAISNSLCAGQAVGTVISDNSLERAGVFRNGQLRSLGYSARGGGDEYGYYVSLGLDEEDGVLPSNHFERRTGRVNFNFTPNSRLTVDAGVGLVDNYTRLPNNDNNVYGYLGVAYLGNPLNVRVQPDGTLTGGTFSNRPYEALEALESVYDVFRVTPSFQVNYTATDWFTNRLVAGGDFTRGRAFQFFPKNSLTWYQGDVNTGDLEEIRSSNDLLTLDYLGTMRTDVTEGIAASLSFGAQLISEELDAVTAEGTGFVTNANRVVGDAAQISADQEYFQNRQVGFLGQLDLALFDRLFLQAGARVDQHSAFGADADPFFLPKVGASYVISDERFWDGFAGIIPSLRLRAAYGTTGRSPVAGASLETFEARPYAIVDATTSAAGVVPLNPGNTTLRPEKGTEFEAGLDAGFLNDRLGVELTYFNKVTKDALLRVPVPPSIGASGTTANPYENIGEVRNSGWEYSLRAAVLNTRNYGLDVWVAGSALDSELVSLGTVEPFGTVARFEEGFPLGFLSTRVIRDVVTETGDARCAGGNPCVIVSNTNEFFGPSLPTKEGNFGTTLDMFDIVRLTGQMDWKTGHYIYNNTAQFRERSFGTAEIAVQRAEVATQEELLVRYGPFVSENGASVPFSAVHHAYFESADYLRLREVAATFSLPQRIASQFRASSASVTIGGRNLALWTDYSGADPEVLSSATGASATGGTGAFVREDFFTVPQPRRLVVRANFSF